MNKIDRKSEQGFTLLELLVSITIAGAAFVLLLSGFGQNVKSTGLAEDYTIASFLARNLAAEFETKGRFSGGLQRGDFGEDYPRFTWSAQALEMNEADSLRLQLKVHFYRQGAERELSFAYVLNPEPTD